MMTRFKSYYMLLPLGLALAVAAWLGFRHEPTRAEVQTGSEQLEARATARAPAASASPSRDAAESRRYALQLDNRFAPAGDDQADAAFELSVLGELAVQQLEAPVGARRLQLSRLELRDGVNGQAADEKHVAELRRALEQPFTVQFGADGRVQSLAFAFAADAFAEGLLRTVAATLQFVSPGEDAIGEWSARELDPVGEAHVSYRRLGARSFLKTKGAYVRLLTDAGLQEPAAAGLTVVAKGNTHLERDGGGGLVQLRHAETITTTAGELSFVNAVSLTLRFTGSFSAPAPVDVGAWRTVRLDQVPVQKLAASQNAQQELLGSASFGDVKKELTDLEPEDVEGRRRVHERLVAALELSRGDARELAPIVAQGHEVTASIALGALADADTAASQTALRELTQSDEIKPELRDAALAMLGLSDAPADESTELAREISSDEAHPSQRTATLALGNMAQNLREAGDAAGGELLAELMARLKSATTSGERELLLAAIGNTGDPALPKLLSPWLEAPAPELRAAATWALRLVDGAEAFKLLASSAASDGAPEVRLKAVSALRYQHAERAVSLMGDLLRKEASVAVRLEALSVLAQSTSAEALGLVQWAAANDPDVTVKQQAATLLEGRG